jgi:hypothetical protein
MSLSQSTSSGFPSETLVLFQRSLNDNLEVKTAGLGFQFTLNYTLYSTNKRFIFISYLDAVVELFLEARAGCYEYFVPKDSNGLAESGDSAWSIKDALCMLDSRQSSLITMN